MHVKDLFESRYQILINKRKKGGIKRTKKLKAFIDYYKTIDDVYENLQEYNPPKKRKKLIMFDEMIADKELKKY